MPREDIPQSELEFRPPQGVRRTKMLRLAAMGYTAAKAARILGIHPMTAQKEYRDPTFRAQVIALVESAFERSDVQFEGEMFTLQDRLRMKAEEAFEVMCSVMEDETQDPALRVKVASNFLDRVPETQPGHQLRTGTLTVEAPQLAAAARAAEEMNNVIPMPPRKREEEIA